MNTSLRMQAIQKLLLSKKPEELGEESMSARNQRFKTIDTSKYTPILVSKGSLRQKEMKTKTLKPRDVSTRVTREVSPISHSSLNRLSSTASSQIFKKLNQKKHLSSSSSVDIIKPISKIVEKASKIKLPSKTLVKSPRKLPKTPTGEILSIRDPSKIRDSNPNPKSELEKAWRKALNLSNGIEPYSGSFTTYTAFIGKGNNSPMVKALFIKRHWWRVIENKDSANFVWSQWKDKQVISELRCCNHKPILNQEQSIRNLNEFQNGKYPCSIDLDNIGFGLIQKSKSYIQLSSEKIHADQQRLHNKLEFNNCLTNKKGLYMTMRNYYQVTNQCVFDKLPITFTVTSIDDEEYVKFLALYNLIESEKKETQSQNLWIVKPGEFSNRGNGITVCQTLDEISAIVKPINEKSYIIQKYIENPLLLNKRKFDIRCYAMITSINGIIQGYFYLDGYLRTTSKEFTLDEISNPFVHLTNDAIQKHSAEYGKFENGNKMSYKEFQRYLDQNFPDRKINFTLHILTQIKEIVKDTMKASFIKIDKNKRLHCMEVFGYDFMIDQNFKPWLIEINTNPCLETSSPHLRNIIPPMLENAFKIVLDSLFPPPINHRCEFNGTNRFELCFHQDIDGKALIENLGENIKFLDG
ncbi:hypothetical protein SteCoe_4404 [Stentor coeruleus]|uniref:Tubulin-tyrosine ligase family protein n=1 Tax=Stentor coeruleus TaxID=5963 RepID=A0A1R2CUW3_9CILI|nr:hypothetical protein SteCoe_4404 [Stentor coeruleus]